EQERATGYNSFEEVLAQKQIEQEKRLRQLELLKSYSGCLECGSWGVDAWSLLEETRLVCQPCLARQHWGINLSEWLENFLRLPVNKSCADKWLKDKEHLSNCACLETEARENYLLTSELLKKNEEKLKDCRCESSPKIRVESDSWTWCERCERSIKAARNGGGAEEEVEGVFEEGEKNQTNSDQKFEQTLQELENPNYAGEGFWSLPENPTTLEKSKYDICQKILAYQQKHKLTDKEIAQRINLTTGETEDILFCRIDYFTLDRLITYANELFELLEVKITKAQERNVSQLANGRKKRKDLNLSFGHDKQGISNELIRKLMNKLNEIPIMKPKKRHGNRDIYVWERIPYNNKKYLIVFWFKDDTDNHL
ncbi:15196_t:CDS:2, partial [Dentiscutata erythropus]